MVLAPGGGRGRYPVGKAVYLSVAARPMRWRGLVLPPLSLYFSSMTISLIEQGLARGGARLRESAPKHQELVTPKTDDELWDFFDTYLNVQFPRKKICENHCAPFTAVADAFFARSPICVWHASRGFGGKSFMLAALSLAEAELRAKVNLLGGSGEQAERVLDYIYGEEVSDVMLQAPNAPQHLIEGGFERGTLKRKTDFIHTGYIRALMASTRSVRGPHPERLRLDEIDEMDLVIFDAAMGQTMALRDIPAQTVASSTWHNANGTMTEILDRAEKRGWPVYQWCFKENLVSNGGWLPDSQVEIKRSTVTAVMFDVEYELQEPNPESRAINTQAVKEMFQDGLGVFEGEHGENCEIEGPVKGATYLNGTDWAKRSDWTINLTYKELRPYEDPSDVPENKGPMIRLVRFERTGRQKWPILVGRMVQRLKVYGANSEIYSAHDETGIGDVISDYMPDDVQSEGIWMAGRLRATILSDYITAVEHGYIECPNIAWMRKEHERASYEDVYGSGDSVHLPDTIAAGALAWYIFKNKPKKRKVRATWGS